MEVGVILFQSDLHQVNFQFLRFKMNRFAIIIAILIPLATVFYVTMNSERKEKQKEETEQVAKPESSATEAEDKKYSVEITGENIEELALQTSQPVVLDFWAPWCGPCLMLGPHLEEIAKDYEGVALVGKVNTDDEQMLALKFRAESIPLVVVMRDGKVLKRFEGFGPSVPDKIRAEIDKLVKP